MLLRTASFALAVHLLACASLPPASPASLVTDAPPERKSGPPPKAADAQPDPESPFARDVRAEAILGRIGFVASRTRREAEEGRRRGDARATECGEKRDGALVALQERARSKRAELREAAFDTGAEVDALWAELGKMEEEARRIATDCNGGEIELTGPLAGAPAARRLSSHESVGDLLKKPIYAVQQIFQPQSAMVMASMRDVRRPPPPASLPPAPAPPPPPAPTASPAQRERARDPAMLLRSARLTLAVFEVEKRMDAVDAAAAELGGYLALRGEREIIVRVPRERFDEAIRRIEKLGDVLHRSVVAEDVTDQFVDLELRLHNAQAVRTRLEKLLEQATVRDAVEIHKELAKVTDEIERLEGKLKLLRDRVAFSTIAVRFEHVEAQRLKTQALLPFPWMRTMGLKPLLEVSR